MRTCRPRRQRSARVLVSDETSTSLDGADDLSLGACSCPRAAPGLARTAAKPSVVKSDAEKTIDVDAFDEPGASRASTISASANGIRRAGAPGTLTGLCSQIR